MNEQEYVYRVVDSQGQPIKTRMTGSGRNGNIVYTVRTYTTSSAALGVASRKNNMLDHEEYRIQVSKVEWHEFNSLTLEIAS